MPYAEYLQTEEWAIKREQALVRDGYRCRLCNSKENLQVHHRTYERRGCEDLNDLTTLCDECHEHFHSRMGFRQIDIMQQTETSVIDSQSREEIRRKWILLLLGILVQKPYLLGHVRGILSSEDKDECIFIDKDMQHVYQIIISENYSDNYTFPESLQETVSKMRELASEHLLNKDEVKIVRDIVEIACRAKREFLLHLNDKLKTDIIKAVNDNDMSLRRKLQEKMLCVHKQLQEIDSVKLLVS
jgi:hypothetical protein